MPRVCFVCLGNICRSPTAEGVMRKLVHEAGLASRIALDSAGTSGYHVGEKPDARATQHAARRGIELSGRARRFVAKDFDEFDYVLAMDASNLEDLGRLAPSDQARSKLWLLRDFDADAPKGSAVPDPYYGGDDGFDEVLDLCLAACRGLLARIRHEHGL